MTSDLQWNEQSRCLRFCPEIVGMKQKYVYTNVHIRSVTCAPVCVWDGVYIFTTQRVSDLPFNYCPQWFHTVTRCSRCTRETRTHVPTNMTSRRPRKRGMSNGVRARHRARSRRIYRRYVNYTSTCRCAHAAPYTCTRGSVHVHTRLRTRAAFGN